MLHLMRRGAQSWIAKALFFILLISFAIWGIGPIFQGGRVHVAAEAGRVKISAAEADQAFRQQVREFENQYGVSLNAQMIAQLGFKQQVLQRLIMQSLYDQEANNLGLRLGNELVRQTIAAQPNFRNEAGQFDTNRFHQLLGQMGMSEATYVQTLKSDIVRLMLMGSIRGGVQPPDTLARTMYAWQNEKRSVDALEIKAADMSGIPAPTDEDLGKFLSEHGDNFMAPEYRSISYAFIDLAKIAEGLKLDDADVKAAYEANPEEYNVPETRDIVQVTTQDKELAEKVAAEAASKPLEDVAKAHDLTARPVTGMTRASILPQLGDVVFTLEANKASQAVQSPMGWHVIVVSKITPPKVQSFDEVKNQIEAGIRLQKGQEQVYELTRKLQDSLAGGATMAEAASEVGLTAETIEAVTHDGYRPDGRKVNGPPVLGNMLQTAFQLQQGQPSQVEEVPSGAFAVVVNSITPAQTKQLADVKDEVKAAWIAERRMNAAADKARETAEAVRNGTAVRGFTRSNGLLRDGSNRDKLPEKAIAHVFESKAGDVLTAESANSVWVIKVADVTPALVDGADLSKTRDELKEQMSNDLLEQFANALRGSYGVEMNDKWLAQSSADAQ